MFHFILTYHFHKQGDCLNLGETGRLKEIYEAGDNLKSSDSALWCHLGTTFLALTSYLVLSVGLHPIVGETHALY